jgi:hypothetical protein
VIKENKDEAGVLSLRWNGEILMMRHSISAISAVRAIIIVKVALALTE